MVENISSFDHFFDSSLQEEMLFDYGLTKPNENNISLIIISDNTFLHRLVIRSLSIYALFLVVVGTFGNTLSIVVLCRRNLRQYVTMRYLIAVSLCDTVSLYGWNLNNFYKFTISPQHSNLEQISLIHCRILSYATFVGLQLSSWCLTAVSVDRCLSLHYLTWKQRWGKLSYTKYHLGILTIVCLSLNSHILFLNGYRTDSSPSTIKCYATRTNSHYIFPQWERVHLVMYNLFPFIIMLFCNIYIISITIRSARIRTSQRLITSAGKNRRSGTSRHRQLSWMLMLVTFAFVLLTLPSCLYFVFFRHRMSPNKYSRTYRHMVQICLSSVQFTSHAINFFLYCFSATNFRNELRDFLSELCLYRFPAWKTRKSSTKITAIQSAHIVQVKDRLAANLDIEYQALVCHKTSNGIKSEHCHQETLIDQH